MVHAWRYQNSNIDQQLTNVSVITRFSDSSITEYQSVQVPIGASIVDALKVLEEKQLSYKIEDLAGGIKITQIMGVSGNWDCQVDGQLCRVGLDKFRLRGGEKIVFINKTASSTER
jgi:hypothetical protein